MTTDFLAFFVIFDYLVIIFNVYFLTVLLIVFFNLFLFHCSLTLSFVTFGHIFGSIGIFSIS